MDKFTNSRFNIAPTIKKARSRFDLSHPIRTNANTGDFFLINTEEVYPGETFSIKNSAFIRLETSLHQTMDNAYFELAHFFVPYRLIWDDFEKFLGFNDDPWARATEVLVPQIQLNNISVEPMSVLNHLGVPAGDYEDVTDPETGEGDVLSISALPIRALFEVWNEYYRDQNYDTIIAYSKDSTDITGDQTFALNGKHLPINTYLTHTTVGSTGKTPLRVNRYHDIFSSVLPAPQKGDPVTISIGDTAPIKFKPSAAFDHIRDSSGDIVYVASDAETGSLWEQVIADGQTGVTSNDYSPMPIALDVSKHHYVDLSEADGITINQLRLAIASQAIKERDARTGNRIKELTYAVWSVDAPSLELDRPEFLGGKRIPITMMEVLQTSETGTTVLGTDAGHSKTYGQDDGFVKSFVEYGLIITVGYFRTARSYSQGINKKLFKKNRFDFYDPMLDNIGEVDVKQKELMALEAPNLEFLDAPIGYQEPWYHLKEGLAHDSGFFQTGITGTLDSWHYGDDYETGHKVIPSSEWLKESCDQVDRTIAVTSDTGVQWSLNMYLEIYATRMMSRYNIPNTFGFGSN